MYHFGDVKLLTGTMLNSVIIVNNLDTYLTTVQRKMMMHYLHASTALVHIPLLSVKTNNLEVIGDVQIA